LNIKKDQGPDAFGFDDCFSFVGDGEDGVDWAAVVPGPKLGSGYKVQKIDVAEEVVGDNLFDQLGTAFQK
jgi:hypothetical protein